MDVRTTHDHEVGLGSHNQHVSTLVLPCVGSLHGMTYASRGKFSCRFTCTGRLLLAQPDGDAVAMFLRFAEPVPFCKLLRDRKVL